MRISFGSLVLVAMVCLGFNSLAHAQYDADTPLSFDVSSYQSPGCVDFNYLQTYGEFPKLPNGTVTQIRFYYSSVDAASITQDSPYVESGFGPDESGYGIALTSPQLCGFQSGQHVYFKYGLVDGNNDVLHFMTDAEYNDYGNSVDVK